VPLQNRLIPLLVYLPAELPNTNSTIISVLNMLFDLLDNLTVIVFSIEIALKWLDNFKDFWKDEWNIFDLIITVVVYAHDIA
jgi:cation channel sperm-associated protein 2